MGKIEESTGITLVISCVNGENSPETDSNISILPLFQLSKPTKRRWANTTFFINQENIIKRQLQRLKMPCGQMNDVKLLYSNMD